MGTPQQHSRTVSRPQSPEQSISPIPIVDTPLFVGQGFADFKAGPLDPRWSRSSRRAVTNTRAAIQGQADRLGYLCEGGLSMHPPPCPPSPTPHNPS